MAFNIFTLLLSLTFFACYQSEYWTDFRDFEQARLDDDLSSYCTKPGLQCADCKRSILCRMEDGNYTATLYEECETGYTCDAGICTNTPNVNCTVAEYKCGIVEGMYPDPKSCKIFHYCLPDKTTPPPTSPSPIPDPDPIAIRVLQLVNSVCQDNYGYNPLTTYCDKKLPVNGTCPPSSIPKCATNGQTGALKENPTIYYICKPVPNTMPRVLYPYLDACKHGRKYDAATYSCK